MSHRLIIFWLTSSWVESDFFFFFFWLKYSFPGTVVRYFNSSFPSLHSMRWDPALEGAAQKKERTLPLHPVNASQDSNYSFDPCLFHCDSAAPNAA